VIKDDLLVMDDFTKGFGSSAESAGVINEATNNPLIDGNNQFSIYEIRMNQSEFTYITNYKYYNSANQVAATANDGSIKPFPQTGKESFLGSLPDWAQQGALEVKASWRILPDDFAFKNRYFTIQADLDNCGQISERPYTFGLVGFHILRLTPDSPSTWFWATFEQVDNVEISKVPQTGLTPSYNPGTSAPYPNYANGFQYEGGTTAPAEFVCPNTVTYSPVDVSFITDSIQADAPTYDAKYQAMLGENSVFQYYQLIGVLNPVTSSSYEVQPGYNGAKTYTNSGQSANTTMETYSQKGSCFQCHAFAAPLGASTDSGYPAQPGNQIFSFLLSNAQPPL